VRDLAAFVPVLLILLPGCAGEPAPVLETRTGAATYLSNELHGNRTASGEVYDRRDLVAAHVGYPLGTRIRVTHLGNGRSVEVRVIDRIGWAPLEGAPLIDLSRAAAERLGMVEEGRAEVRLEVLEWGAG
jgi:rare lipoprotein A